MKVLIAKPGLDGHDRGAKVVAHECLRTLVRDSAILLAIQHWLERNTSEAEASLVAGSFGFWSGFDRFVERSVTDRDRGTLTVADAVAGLRAERDRRFFVFVHTYKTHDPYVVTEPYEAFFQIGRAHV